MATRYVWDAYSVQFPDSNFPEIKRINTRMTLCFDATTDETCYLEGIAPQGLTGTLTLVVYYIMASATSGSVRFGAQVEAITPGDSVDLDSTTSFDTTNTNGGTVPGTAGYEQSISITLTNADSIAAGDEFRISFYRDADGTSGTDDATGDACVKKIELRDSA